MPLLQDRTAVFIVRLWCECDETGTAQAWRGTVEHIQSGRQRYFRRYDDLIAFVRRLFPDLDADPHPPEPSPPDPTPDQAAALAPQIPSSATRRDRD